MKKKLISLLLVGVMCLSVFTGCGKKQTSNQVNGNKNNATDSVQETEKEEPVTISVLLHSSWRTDATNAAFKAIEEKENVKFEFEEVAEGDAGEQIIFAKMATHDVPDILWWQSAGAANIKMGADKFEDLSGDWMKNYDENALKTSSYTIDDRLIRAPFGEAVVYGVCYNKQIFKDNNLEIPNTWDEMVAIMDKLKDTGIIPMYYSGNDPWTLQIMPLDSFAKEGKKRGDVQQLIDGLNTNKIKWTDLTEVKDALNKTKSMLDDGYVQETFLSDTYQDAQQALLDGEAAMYIHATWITNELEKLTSDVEELDNLGFFPIPMNDETKVSAFITPNGFYVPKKAKHKDLAKKIVMELSGKTAAEAYFNAKPGIPFIKGITVDNLYGIQKDAAAIIDSGNTLPPAIDYIKYSAGTFDTYIADILVENMTVDDMLKLIDEGFEKQALDLGDENWK